MTISNYKLKSIGACIIAIMAFDNDGLCQSYPVIDIDNVETTILPDKNSEDEYSISYPDGGVLHFDDILTIVGKQKTSYEVEYIPLYEEPEIYQGRVFINLDRKKSVYDLESLNEIPNANNVYYSEYIVTKHKERVYTKDEKYKSTHGKYPSKFIECIVSVDAITGDTLWKKQMDNVLNILSTQHVSVVLDSIIDNKTGRVLFVFRSSTNLGIQKMKEDNGYLYLTRKAAKGIKELIAIDMQKGEAIWKARGDFSNFYIDETRIYTNDQCAIDKKTGKLLWSNTNNLSLVGIVGNYIIAHLWFSGEGAEMHLISKDTGKTVGYLWSDKEFCKSCFGDDYDSCASNFVFAEQGEGNKTAAIIKCNDGVYLYVFEAK